MLGWLAYLAYIQIPTIGLDSLLDLAVQPVARGLAGAGKDLIRSRQAL